MSTKKVLNVQNSWDVKLPILLLKANILKNEADGAITFSAIFKNLRKNTISSAIFELVVYDKMFNEVQRLKSLSYKNIEVKEAGVFGADKIIALNSDAMNIDIIVKNLTYADGSTWVNKFNQKFDTSKHPKKISEFLGFLDSEFLGENNLNSDTYEYIPKEIDSSWICTCGTDNETNNSICKECGMEKLKLFNLFDPALLFEKFNAKENENTVKKMQKKSGKKLNKVGIIGAILILALISIFSVNSFKDLNEFNKAKSTYQKSVVEIFSDENMEVLNVVYVFDEKDTDYNGNLGEGGKIYSVRINVDGFNGIAIPEKFEIFKKLRNNSIDTPYIFSVNDSKVTILSERKEWYWYPISKVIITSDNETFYEPKTQNNTNKPITNNNSNSIKYDNNDYYYRSNDYNHDGRLSGDEWDAALDDYLTDLGY